MEPRYTEAPERDWSDTRIANRVGISLLVMFFLGIFAEFGIRTRLIDWDDPLATLQHIQGALGLFQSGILAWLLILYLDVVIAVALYAWLRRHNRSTAFLMASLRLVYVAIKGAAIGGLFLANDIYASAIAPDQLHAQADRALLLLRLHHYGFSTGLFFFGLHLVVLAVLLPEVKAFPKLIRWLLLVAGVGYCLNSLLPLAAGAAEGLQQVVLVLFILPMTFAELSLGIWLLVKRRKLALSEKR